MRCLAINILHAFGAETLDLLAANALIAKLLFTLTTLWLSEPNLVQGRRLVNEIAVQIILRFGVHIPTILEKFFTERVDYLIVLARAEYSLETVVKYHMILRADETSFEITDAGNKGRMLLREA
jgi:hypothetical protein